MKMLLIMNLIEDILSDVECNLSWSDGAKNSDRPITYLRQGEISNVCNRDDSFKQYM